MASKPRSTRSSFPSLPPTVPSGSNRSSSSSSRDGSPSANAIAHMQYTQSLGALGKKERGRKKGSTGPNAHDGDVSLDSSAADQQEDEDETRSTNQRRSSVDVGGRGAKRDASVVKKEQSEGGSIPLGKKGAAAAAAARAQEEEEEDEDEDDEEGADITRCVCGITESDDMMIQCDTCNVWQHGACVGIPTEEETPDEYFCEKCRPDLHLALKKWMRSRGRGGIFLPPSASDLNRLKPLDSTLPPNQSKRWTQDIPNLPPLEDDESSDASDRPTVNGRSQRRSRSSLNKPAKPVLSSASSRQQKAELAPPPPPARTTVSHKKKDPSDLKSASHSSNLPPPSTPALPPPKSHKRQTSSTHPPPHRASPKEDRSSSTSPPPQPKRPKSPPKRRSTMNSRDAGLEEAIRASLLAAKMAGETGEGEEPSPSRRSPSSSNGSAKRDPHAETSTNGKKRIREKSEEITTASTTKALSTTGIPPGRRGKKAKKEPQGINEQLEDDLLNPPSNVSTNPDALLPSSASNPRPSSSSNAVALSSTHSSHDHPPNTSAHSHHPHFAKGKHPNQYTYRPKADAHDSATSPVKASSAGKFKSSAETSGAGPFTSSSSNNARNRQQSGPSHHSSRYDAASSSSHHPSTSSHHHHASESRSSSNLYSIPDHLSHLSHFLPPPSIPRLPIPPGFSPASAAGIETTKIRWPTKRMTVGEMRKRVRAVLDLVGRWPTGDREEGGSGLDLLLPPPSASSAVGQDEDGDESMDAGRGKGKGKAVAITVVDPLAVYGGKTRAEEVEELVRNLLEFETRFGNGAGSSGSNGRVGGGGEGIQTRGGNDSSAAAAAVREAREMAAAREAKKSESTSASGSGSRAGSVKPSKGVVIVEGSGGGADVEMS